METQIPNYQGKPTAYLDQNILDLFVKYDLDELIKILTSKYQVVYSDETLKEIDRSGDSAMQFIEALKRLDAYHLKLVLSQPSFKATDKATITKRDPNDAFKEYIENKHLTEISLEGIEQFLFKFCGGRKGDPLSLIEEEQKSAFEKLMFKIKSDAQELDEIEPNFIKTIEAATGDMQREFNKISDSTSALMKENIPDDKNWSGIKSFREAVALGPMQLNNIEPPFVLRQIWDFFKNQEPYSSGEKDIDDFFGLKTNPIYPDQPHFDHQKVTSIYSMLNTIGYYPDSKVHQKRRFTAAMSDTQHASLATFCDTLLSADKAFIKKVRAAYEYLAVPTKVTFVQINKKGSSDN
ncbi:hypothetical protein [Thalassotalea sp. ND16A]|uniref:hypothetical protein n=1 Tax=Thalassotalea sp. ND16A TaxID=1535422 RepID=UPI00051DE93B|nr:hypothetical protein [Thalassotalea sp. ND16A]KGJ98128.1 hypothetical protein ND16A_0933 [Thalassotalea sp. ND16A]